MAQTKTKQFPADSTSYGIGTPSVQVPQARAAPAGDLFRVLRRTHWQEARGQLLAVLETYTGTTDEELEEFERVDDVVQEFLSWMEDEL